MVECNICDNQTVPTRIPAWKSAPCPGCGIMTAMRDIEADDLHAEIARLTRTLRAIAGVGGTEVDYASAAEAAVSAAARALGEGDEGARLAVEALRSLPNAEVERLSAKVQHWRSVTLGGIPETGRVIVVDAWRDRWLAAFRGGKFFNDGGVSINGVTHWMPLPAAQEASHA